MIARPDDLGEDDQAFCLYISFVYVRGDCIYGFCNGVNMYNENTKVKDILQQYPWLREELVKIDPRFKIINSPIGKALIKNATVADVAKKGGVTSEFLLTNLQKMIDAH